jgi:hypothetical protein
MLMYQLIMCTRALDSACLKFKVPVELLHYPKENYVVDEELVSSTICPWCIYLSKMQLVVTYQTTQDSFVIYTEVL